MSSGQYVFLENMYAGGNTRASIVLTPPETAPETETAGGVDARGEVLGRLKRGEITAAEAVRLMEALP